MKTVSPMSAIVTLVLTAAAAGPPGSHILPEQTVTAYPDHRPAAIYRLAADDQGPVLLHGDGPAGCDKLGARDVWLFEHAGKYYAHYDGAGPNGWLACLAESDDLIHWTKKGPILDFGKPGSDDSASASYATTFLDGTTWHSFYLGTPHASPPPSRIPSFPYQTLNATAPSPTGPWTKQPAVVPFRPEPGTYYSAVASPGQMIKHDGQYLMFFSAQSDNPTRRTISIARTQNLDGPWKIQPAPIVPPAEQIENSSLYFEPANQTWFLFTNHIGVRNGTEYTDAIWVYWSKDLEHWDPARKAVVLDGANCSWSKSCIGLPSVLKVGDRLAILYDGPGGTSISHMHRDLGLAWLNLPLLVPE
jgi:predicted GH43/DUF377 family glycosyl hydrolase